MNVPKRVPPTTILTALTLLAKNRNRWSHDEQQVGGLLMSEPKISLEGSVLNSERTSCVVLEFHLRQEGCPV
jgi:hypothetical protein